MTTEQINIALAKWEGWKNVRTVDCGRPMGIPPGDVSTRPITDFLHDLNATHDLPHNLSILDYQIYASCLNDIVARDNSRNSTGYHTCDATARQRCEALLRTLGMWED